MSSNTSNCPPSLLNKQLLPDVDEIIKGCIESIWDKYDTDGNGYLDKEECFEFIMESVQGNTTDQQFVDPDESDDEENESKEKFKRHFE